MKAKCHHWILGSLLCWLAASITLASFVYSRYDDYMYEKRSEVVLIEAEQLLDHFENINRKDFPITINDNIEKISSEINRIRSKAYRTDYLSPLEDIIRLAKKDLKSLEGEK